MGLFGRILLYISIIICNFAAIGAKKKAPIIAKLMNDAYFHILDIAHGVVMTVLMYFVFRLLVFRREGAVRVRYLAAGLLVLALLQTLNYFDEENEIQNRIAEIISIIVDCGSILLSILILWLFSYRNTLP